MRHINEIELDSKIKTFLARKSYQHPELIKTRKSLWTRTAMHGSAARFFASHVAL